MTKKALMIFIALLVLLGGTLLFWPSNNIATPASVDLYDGKGNHRTIKQPTDDQMQAVKKLLSSSNIAKLYPDSFPNEQHQSYGYLKTNQGIALHFATPIELKGISTKEVHLINFQDPYLKNRLYVKNESDGNWHVIELKNDPAEAIQKMILATS